MPISNFFSTYDKHNKVFKKKNIWRNNELQNTAFRFRGPTHPLPPDLLGCCSVKANIINGSDLLMQGADGCRYEVPISTGLSGIYRPSRSGRGGNRAALLRALGEPVHLKNRLQCQTLRYVVQWGHLGGCGARHNTKKNMVKSRKKGRTMQ